MGQKHIVGENTSLNAAIQQQKPFSMILWGEAGCGKTTLANLLAKEFKAKFIPLSAVFSGVKDLKEAINLAQKNLDFSQRTLLFVDEIHRFNKTQQDVFLPYVEDATIILIGATTENPAFSINSALLSRLRLFHLEPLSPEDLGLIFSRALTYLNRQDLENLPILQKIINSANGDARAALNRLEEFILLLDEGKSPEEAEEFLATRISYATQDNFYEILSAFHKSLRGSSPDGAMYWFARWIDAAQDPLVLCRRMCCVAAEDIGTADPNALNLALNAWNAFERLGAPEGYLAIAEAINYLALAPKSNASYLAMKKAFELAKKYPPFPVPKHLCNAPTQVHKGEGLGIGYRYAHDEEFAYAAGQEYLPPQIKERNFYQPNNRGLEIKLAEKLKRLAELDKLAISSLRSAATPLGS